ncbi:MAG: hypothetical protein ACREV6_19405 [Clostridium sp.]|uniref:hypothetical protein n=1 Tax=Clostridium sp. TaxID=1506 RepID=UPI003D6D0EBB
MKFVQIYNGKVHWIFEAEEKPVFAPNIVLVDITDNADNKEIQCGWDYNEETSTFHEHVEVIVHLPEPVDPNAPTDEQLMTAEALIDLNLRVIELENK